MGATSLVKVAAGRVRGVQASRRRQRSKRIFQLSQFQPLSQLYTARGSVGFVSHSKTEVFGEPILGLQVQADRLIGGAPTGHPVTTQTKGAMQYEDVLCAFLA
jgi:hypothetical protein